MHAQLSCWPWLASQLADPHKALLTPCNDCNVLNSHAGVGFGSVMAKATKVTDQMFVAASQVGGGNVQSYLLAGFPLKWAGGGQQSLQTAQAAQPWHPGRLGLHILAAAHP